MTDGPRSYNGNICETNEAVINEFPQRGQRSLSWYVEVEQKRSSTEDGERQEMVACLRQYADQIK